MTNMAKLSLMVNLVIEQIESIVLTKPAGSSSSGLPAPPGDLTQVQLLTSYWNIGVEGVSGSSIWD